MVDGEQIYHCIAHLPEHDNDAGDNEPPAPHVTVTSEAPSVVSYPAWQVYVMLDPSLISVTSELLSAFVTSVTVQVTA